VRLAFLAVFVVALSLWTHARPQAADVAPPDFEALVPLALEDWAGGDAPPLEAEAARILGADEYVHRYYTPQAAITDAATEDPDAVIEMDIAYYARPQAGAAMHSPLNCLPGNGWQVLDSGVASIGRGSNAINVRRLVVGLRGHRVAMTYWFQNRAGVIGHEYRQRFELLMNGLRGRPADAALVRVMALDTPNGHRAMKAFSDALVERLAAFR
jgi:EpsI family protein